MKVRDRKFSSNPYYDPYKCGLDLADSVEGDCDYDFDMVIVWQDIQSGEYFFGHDSGCSCPAPFEDYHRLSDLTHLTEDTLFNLKTDVMNIRGLVTHEGRKFISKWNRKIKNAGLKQN